MPAAAAIRLDRETRERYKERLKRRLRMARGAEIPFVDLMQFLSLDPRHAGVAATLVREILVDSDRPEFCISDHGARHLTGIAERQSAIRYLRRRAGEFMAAAGRLERMGHAASRSIA